MINLFERFDNKAIRIYNSFKLAKLPAQTIVLNETGFLPNDVMTPYRYFANHHSTSESPFYFNQLKLPRFWMIKDEGRYASVKDKGELRATVYYHAKRRRIVERVEWLTVDNQVQFTDYYNKQGFKYAQIVFDPTTTQPVMRMYFDGEGHVFYTENLMTQNIVLHWKNHTYHFYSHSEFIDFFLADSRFATQTILTNSLKVPLNMIRHQDSQNIDYMYWQSEITSEIMQQLRYMWKMTTHTLKVIVPEPERYQRLIEQTTPEEHARIIKGGYVYQFKKHHRVGANIFITTHSAQMLELDTIIQLNPKATFHIASLTEMSQIALQFSKYTNVHLYPKITQTQYHKLFQQCEVYLDINEGKEVFNSVRTAFDNQLLILANRAVVHNTEVVASDNIRAQGLGKLLNEVLNDQEMFNTRLRLQHKKASAYTPTEFKAIFQ